MAATLLPRFPPIGGGRGLNHLQMADAGHVERLQHLLGVGVNFEDILLVDVRDLRDVIVTALSLFLLKFDGNTSDWSPLDPFHEMSRETSDLVPQSFRWNDGDLFGDPLVGVEIGPQLGVVFFHDDSGCFLHGFCSDATHLDSFCLLKVSKIYLGQQKIDSSLTRIRENGERKDKTESEK